MLIALRQLQSSLIMHIDHSIQNADLGHRHLLDCYELITPMFPNPLPVEDTLMRRCLLNER